MENSTFRKYISSFATPHSFGVDINNNELKIFQIERERGKEKIVGWSRKTLSEEVMSRDFFITDTKKFTQVLKNTLEASKGKHIRGNSVVISIPENKIFMRILTVPLMSEKEAAESIKWEVESNIPISIDEAYFDWQVMEKTGNEMKVLVVAAARKTIDNIISAFDEANLQVRIIEADSVAVGRCVLSAKEKNPILLVDIGVDGTSYFIYQDGYPVFSSSSSVSGRLFTDAVAKYYGVDWRKAEQYKTRVGLGSTRKEKEEMMKLFKPLLSTSVSEIEKTMSFFSEKLSVDKDRGIEKVIVCGGGSNLKGLKSYLAINLKRKVVQANPWQNISLGDNIPPISMEEAQSFITAIGLALRCCD